MIYNIRSLTLPHTTEYAPVGTTAMLNRKVRTPTAATYFVCQPSLAFSMTYTSMTMRFLMQAPKRPSDGTTVLTHDNSHDMTSLMKRMTPRSFLGAFYTTEEQAQHAGVKRGTYNNATHGPAHDRYLRRVLFTLMKDLAHESADDPRNKDFYQAAIRQAQRFITELRKSTAHSQS